MTIKSTSDNLQTPLSQITSNIEDPLVLRRHLLSYVLYLAAGIGAVLLFYEPTYFNPDTTMGSYCNLFHSIPHPSRHHFYF